MKAAIALILIYIGTFLVAIQGVTQNPVEAAAHSASQAPGRVDPSKEADIRSLIELTSAHDGSDLPSANRLVAIYDKHFSEDEIRSLLQFYSSPVGKKAAAEWPAMMKELQAASPVQSAAAQKAPVAKQVAPPSAPAAKQPAKQALTDEQVLANSEQP